MTLSEWIAIGALLISVIGPWLVKREQNIRLEERLKLHDAAQSKEMARIDQWIKDKEHFDYEFRHEEFGPRIDGINAKLLPLIQRMATVEEDIKNLRGWKHMVIDPMVPRAIEEHERRLNRIESKVFNGAK